jgi:hypothetical protein
MINMQIGPRNQGQTLLEKPNSLVGELGKAMLAAGTFGLTAMMGGLGTDAAAAETRRDLGVALAKPELAKTRLAA